jgi:serine/threonine protein kinase
MCRERYVLPSRSRPRIAYSMSALTGAHDKAGILHRDISPGNILIYGDGGLLIDWDLAVPLSGVGNPVHIGFRTGTWQVSLVVI